MQEDQLYAMEDYLAQYQQLICKYRSENAALRRRLADDVDDEVETPTPRAAPRKRNGPAIEAPPTPRTDGTEPPLDVPEVPPLEETTSSNSDLKFQSALADGEAASATGQHTPDASAIAPAVALEPAPEPNRVEDVWLHGKIVANDAGGGPRLVVDVEPLDGLGRYAKFDGELSLMLLAPADGGEPQSLARWDFAPPDVQTDIDSAIGEPAIRFYLELPEDAAAESTQLWVRLLPSAGGKVLAHAPVDLRQPGEFTSRIDKKGNDAREITSEEPVTAAVYSEPTGGAPPDKSDLYDGGWTIARPGEPAGLPTAEDQSDGEWRASLEPPPPVVAASKPARPTPRVHRPTTRLKAAKTAVTGIRRPSGWSPDRPTYSAAIVPPAATRPRWSATR